MHFSSRFSLSSSFVRWLALLGACLLSGAAPAWAQSAQILVVSDEQVPDKLYEAVSDALGEVGSVVSSSGYTSKLRARNQEPDSEEALTKIAPQMGASLIVVLRPVRAKLKIQLRDGHTGKVIKQTSVPARAKRPKLAGPARKRLLAATKRALSKVGPAPSPSFSASSSSSADSDDDFAEEPSPAAPARATTAPSRPSQPVRKLAPVVQAQPEDAEDTSFEEGEAEEAPPREEATASEKEGIWLPLHAGVGVGSRSIVVPTQPGRGGGNRVDTEFAPSLDIGVGLGFALSPSWLMRVLANYRTILELNAAYLTPTGASALSGLSSHSVIVGAALGHLSDGRDSFAVHTFVGWAYRSMSASEPMLPSASIQGVVLRPELEIPFANRKLMLRIAPELILILVQDATLPQNNAGVAGGVGYALGGEASLDFHVSQTVALSAHLRESRGSSPSSWGSAEIENERYIALRFGLRL